MRFKGKSIIVTGAGSGIGRAAAWLFASEGAQVICADISADVDKTAEMIGDRATAIRMDAGSEADVIRTVELAMSAHGRLDVMFANAGISGGMANIFPATPEGRVVWNKPKRIDLRAALGAIPPPPDIPKPVNVPKPAPMTTTQKTGGILAGLAAAWAVASTFFQTHPIITGGGVFLIILVFLAFMLLRKHRGPHPID